MLIICKYGCPKTATQWKCSQATTQRKSWDKPKNLLLLRGFFLLKSLSIIKKECSTCKVSCLHCCWCLSIFGLHLMLLQTIKLPTTRDSLFPSILKTNKHSLTHTWDALVIKVVRQTIWRITFIEKKSECVIVNKQYGLCSQEIKTNKTQKDYLHFHNTHSLHWNLNLDLGRAMRNNRRNSLIQLYKKPAEENKFIHLVCFFFCKILQLNFS